MIDKENKSAREMFEELDFKFKEEYEEILYEYGTCKFDIVIIYFDKTDKTVNIHDGSCGSVSLNVNILNAINKQIEELDWE